MGTQMGSRFVRTLEAGAVAGAAGGLAEIAWIMLYGAATGAPTEPVARGVVVTLMPALAASSWIIWLGILTHLILSVALGLGLAAAVRHFASRGGASYSQFALVMVTLSAIWAMNFFFALPYLNPKFVHLLPYGVTFLSKLFFGASAAMVLVTDGRLRARSRSK